MQMGGKGASSRGRGDPSEEISACFSEDRNRQRLEQDNDSNDSNNVKRRRTSTIKTTTSATATTAAKLKKPRPLVLCLNTKGEETLFMDALLADGVPPDRLPEARKIGFLTDFVVR